MACSSRAAVEGSITDAEHYLLTAEDSHDGVGSIESRSTQAAATRSRMRRYQVDWFEIRSGRDLRGRVRVGADRVLLRTSSSTISV
jgi:hypothetical protein